MTAEQALAHPYFDGVRSGFADEVREAEAVYMAKRPLDALEESVNELPLFVRASVSKCNFLKFSTLLTVSTFSCSRPSLA